MRSADLSGSRSNVGECPWQRKFCAVFGDKIKRDDIMIGGAVKAYYLDVFWQSLALRSAEIKFKDYSSICIPDQKIWVVYHLEERAFWPYL